VKPEMPESPQSPTQTAYALLHAALQRKQGR